MNSFSRIIPETVFYLIIHQIFALRQQMMLDFLVFVLICLVV